MDGQQKPGCSEPVFFFEMVLPAAIRRAQALGFAGRGSLSWFIRNHGSWHIRFNAVSEPVRVGFDEAADLRIWCSLAAYQMLWRGSLVSPTRRDWRCSGETLLLERVQQIVHPPKSTLSVRTRAAATPSMETTNA